MNAGTLTLLGHNTNSGNTTVASGATLEIGYNTALASGNLILNGGSKVSANNTTDRTFIK